MEVYTLYKDMLYNVSLRIVANKQDAQDLVHDTFIKAFQNISKVREDLSLGAWLKRIVINCSLDFLKDKKKLEWSKEAFNHAPDEDEDKAEAFQEITYRVAEVKKAISMLKDKYRIILVLYLLEDYTHKEIAGHLGLKESTVRNQYRRGKLLLKKHL